MDSYLQDLIRQNSISSSYNERRFAKILERLVDQDSGITADKFFGSVNIDPNGSKVLNRARSELSRLLVENVDPIGAYRWAINYVNDIIKGDVSNLEIIKTNRSDLKHDCVNMITKFSDLGIKILPGQKFGFVVCKNPNSNLFLDRVYETGYFLRLPEEDKPEIDPTYYIYSLTSLDRSLSKIGELPKTFNSLEVERKNKPNPIKFVQEPFLFMLSTVRATGNLDELTQMFERLVSESKAN